MLSETQRQEYIDRMVENLPVLRAKLKLRQADLAQIIGVSSYSISGMEKGQRKMIWNTFMSILPVFLQNEETTELMRVLGIYTPELERFLKFRLFTPLSEDELDCVAAAGTKAMSVGKGKKNKKR